MLKLHPLKTVGLLLLVAMFALACKDSSSEAAERAKAQQPGPAASANGEAAPAQGGDKEADVADAPAANIYPGFNFGLLSPAERRTFVEIAEAELCPCPDSTESLHECMQKTDRCGTAMQVASVMGMAIKEGLNKTDTLDRVAQYVEASNKRHEFTLEGVPFKGNKDAKVVLVEFADFQCPHCKDASKVLDEVVKTHGDKVAIYFKQFPLGRPESQLAAQASLAAHKQGKFWPMHDLIFQHQHNLSRARIEGFAHQIGLNFERFKRDMDSPEIVAQVRRDRLEGDAAGITGTPAFYINGRTYLDDKSPERVRRAIDAEHAEATASNP